MGRQFTFLKPGQALPPLGSIAHQLDMLVALCDEHKTEACSKRLLSRSRLGLEVAQPPAVRVGPGDVRQAAGCAAGLEVFGLKEYTEEDFYTQMGVEKSSWDLKLAPGKHEDGIYIWADQEGLDMLEACQGFRCVGVVGRNWTVGLETDGGQRQGQRPAGSQGG
jgi:hypothetical protein